MIKKGVLKHLKNKKKMKKIKWQISRIKVMMNTELKECKKYTEKIEKIKFRRKKLENNRELKKASTQRKKKENRNQKFKE